MRGLAVRGKRPILEGAGGIRGGAVLRINGNHYRIERLELTMGGDSLGARGFYNVGDQNVFRESLVHGCPTGVSSADRSGSLTLEWVEVRRCGRGDREHQIYVGSDNARFPNAVFRMRFCYVHGGAGGNNVKSRSGRNELHYNWIEGAYYHELDLIGADPEGQAKAPDVREDSEVVGNVLRKTAGSPGSIARLGSDGTGSSRGRYRFVNNTFLFAGKRPADAFRLGGPVELLESFNNVFFNPDFGPVRVVDRSRVPAPLFQLRSPGAGNWVPKTATGVPREWADTLRGSDPGIAELIPLRHGALFNAGRPAPANDFPGPVEIPRFEPPTPGAFPDATPHVRPKNGPIDIGAFEGR